MEKNYKEYLQQITTFIFDVDGVLTDGIVTVTTSGELYRSMNIKDGYALKTAIERGYNICIISGGTNEGVRKRLEVLGITDIHLGAKSKTQLMFDYLKTNNISSDTVLYMGDDIPDLKPMQEVILPCCPKDAVLEIKNASKYVSHKTGGKGCVRDVIEQVLKAQGKWL